MVAAGTICRSLPRGGSWGLSAVWGGADSLLTLRLLTDAPVANLSNGIFPPAPGKHNALVHWGSMASARDGLARGRATVSYDEYRRLHAACIDMASQSNMPDLRARWLAMADVWLRRAIELRDGSGHIDQRSLVAPRLH
jgi:hypothetical protein